MLGDSGSWTRYWNRFSSFFVNSESWQIPSIATGWGGNGASNTGEPEAIAIEWFGDYWLTSSRVYVHIEHIAGQFNHGPGR